MRKPSKYSTTTEARLRELAAQGLNWVQIAKRENINVSQLRATAQVLGIKSGRGIGASVDCEKYVADLADGMSLAEVGRKHGVTRQCVHLQLKRHGLPTTAYGALRYKLGSSNA